MNIDFTNYEDFKEFVKNYFLCKKCGKSTNGQYKLNKQIVCADCYKKLKGEEND